MAPLKTIAPPPRKIVPPLIKMAAPQGRIVAPLQKYDEVLGLHAAQKKEYGDQFGATAALNQAWDQAGAAYLRTFKLARIAFRDDPQGQAALMLGGDRARSLAGWLDQARLFYKNLLAHADLQAKIQRLGVTPAILTAEASLVAEVEAKQIAQRKETGEAHEATEKRDTQIKALDRWSGDLKAVARVAFETRPQVLDRLGIS